MSEKAPPYGNTAEPKPSTEAELADLESQLLAKATEPETANVSAQLALRLVAEIRRLRRNRDDMIRAIEKWAESFNPSIIQDVAREAVARLKAEVDR